MRNKLLQANAKKTERPLAIMASLTLEAAAADGKSARKFAMDAYTGSAMNFYWSDHPVVVDLAGLEISAKARPILKDHSPQQLVGHTERIWVEGGRTLKVTGIVSGDGEAAREVVGSADKGFPWQASIGAEILRIEEVRAGTEVTVNGQKFSGPIEVVRASRLAEVSFVALGADDSTAARMVAARNASKQPGQEKIMTFLEWLKAKAFDLAGLNDTQKATLQAAYDAEQKALSSSNEDDKSDDENVSADPVKASRIEAAKETRRIGDIRKLCAGKHADLEATAIEEGWSKEKLEAEVNKLELKALREARPNAPQIMKGSEKSVTGEVLEAAVLQASRASKSMMAHLSEKAMNAADREYKRQISLQQLLLEAAWANGYTGRFFNIREVLRAAFQPSLQAGFSTIDISGVLSNVANKGILEAFMAVEQTWRDISGIRPVNDFKEITSYRLTGANQYEKVGPGGKIKHGTLGELSYTNKAETYAKMLGITRQDIVNDDMGALAQVPRILGRGAALALNEVFWTEFLDNASFFASGNLNYFEGAGTTLQISQLQVALQKFRDQKDADGKPMAIAPAILLVPTALEMTAKTLVNSAEVRDTTASTKAPTSNPFQGMFTPRTSAYLGNSSFSGYSVTAWYLLANPADVATIETVFLNGQETPTVETADADFDELGIQMRGFHDFGVNKQEYRAGVKSKGAA